MIQNGRFVEAMMRSLSKQESGMNKLCLLRTLLWAMRFNLDGMIDFRSLRWTKEQCIKDFEESFGQDVMPEYLSGWGCIPVMIVGVWNDE